MEGIPKNKVLLVPRNEQWADEFQRVKRTFQNIYGDNIVDIQHVGSTAIKGIMAKPMLDIAIVFKEITALLFDTMEKNGYTYYGEVASGKYLFVLRGKNDSSLQHIHCYEEENILPFIDQIEFRDFLRTHSQYAKEYELLKQALSKKYANDREKYTQGKQDFFDKVKKLAAKIHKE